MKIQHSCLLIISAFLAACSSSVPAPTATVAPATPVPPPTSAPRPTPTAAAVIPPVNSIFSPFAPPLASPILPTVAANLPAPPQFAGKTLTVVTHDSFSLNKKLIAGFELQTGAKVNVTKSGDTGAMLNKLILSKASPLGDVVFGIDNTFSSRALDADLFEPYAPKGLDGIPAALRLDKENRLIPIDYGFVNLNYDLNHFKTQGLAVPQTLRDLTKADYKGKLVVQNPATSSPGLAFMLASIATFGESGNYTWKDFWRDLRKNEVVVTSGWEQAYYDKFSGGSGKGNVPMVGGCFTGPAAEVFFWEGGVKEPPNG
ncbi:MAG: thiamine ABC transporter substrate-binding protein, partial [Anaerolineae bacterium]|nr:thiamine ABC transporter substrate-binding protein [Anaerolineae bacterium]